MKCRSGVWPYLTVAAIAVAVYAWSVIPTEADADPLESDVFQWRQVDEQWLDAEIARVHAENTSKYGKL